MALSPDDENKYVAIDGFGVKTSDVAVLERSSGKMVHHAVAVPPKGEQTNSLWSIAYAPDGGSVAFGDSFGGVWTWDFKELSTARQTFRPAAVGTTNKVRHQLHLLTNAVDFRRRGERDSESLGSVREPSLDPLKNFDTEGNAIFRVALSPDEKWYAAAPANKPFVVLRSVDGDPAKNRKIPLNEGEIARAVAFDLNSERLALSIASRLEKKKGFLMEAPDRLAFYNLNSKLVEPEGPHDLYRAWFFAFHPNGKEVAIAAGQV